MSATLTEIKELSATAKRKEKKLIEAQAEKKELIKTLKGVKDQVNELDVSDETKDSFKDYIDDIIDNDGVLPKKNPIAEYIETLEEKAEEKYEKAKAILGMVNKAGGDE